MRSAIEAQKWIDRILKVRTRVLEIDCWGLDQHVHMIDTALRGVWVTKNPAIETKDLYRRCLKLLAEMTEVSRTCISL